MASILIMFRATVARLSRYVYCLHVHNFVCSAHMIAAAQVLHLSTILWQPRHLFLEGNSDHRYQFSQIAKSAEISLFYTPSEIEDGIARVLSTNFPAV